MKGLKKQIVEEKLDTPKGVTLHIPKSVKLSVKARHVVVVGERGKLERNFRHLNVEIKSIVKEQEDGSSESFLQFVAHQPTRKHTACLKTICSLINNMIIGVTSGFVYKMRYVYAHFPINVIIGDDAKSVQIRNFLGQKVVFNVNLLEGVTCKEGAKDELILQGNDVEKVSQSAASIQQSCLVKNKDIRKFLDGIYVSERAGKVV